MDYHDGLIKNTEFLTTSELAEKLKMNVQVITRKVQSGEIFAYKIGKDWRIPEQAVFTWLETQSNQTKANTSPSLKTNPIKKTVSKKAAQVKSDAKVASPQLDDAVSKLANNDRKFMLEYILAQFEANRVYNEKELSSVISRYSDNLPEIRNELLAEKMMAYSDGQYQRLESYRLSDY